MLKKTNNLFINKIIKNPFKFIKKENYIIKANWLHQFAAKTNKRILYHYNKQSFKVRIVVHKEFKKFIQSLSAKIIKWNNKKNTLYFLNNRWKILPFDNPLDGPFFNSLFGPLAKAWIWLKNDLLGPLAFVLFFSWVLIFSFLLNKK